VWEGTRLDYEVVVGGMDTRTAPLAWMQVRMTSIGDKPSSNADEEKDELMNWNRR